MTLQAQVRQVVMVERKQEPPTMQTLALKTGRLDEGPLVGWGLVAGPRYSQYRLK